MDEIARIGESWTDLWNRERTATELVSTDARVHFGRTPPVDRARTAAGPDELQEVIDGIRALHPGLRYGWDIPPVAAADPAGADALVTVIWHASAPDLPLRTGIDVLRVRNEQVIEAWSVTGDLALPEQLERVA